MVALSECVHVISVLSLMTMKIKVYFLWPYSYTTTTTGDSGKQASSTTHLPPLFQFLISESGF